MTHKSTWPRFNTWPRRIHYQEEYIKENISKNYQGSNFEISSCFAKIIVIMVYLLHNNIKFRLYEANKSCYVFAEDELTYIRIRRTFDFRFHEPGGQRVDDQNLPWKTLQLRPRNNEARCFPHANAHPFHILLGKIHHGYPCTEFFSSRRVPGHSPIAGFPAFSQLARGWKIWFQNREV